MQYTPLTRSRSRKRILAVEDSPSDTSMIRFAFESMEDCPVGVHAVDSVADFMTFLAESEEAKTPVADLILLDLSLDDGNGFEVLLKLKQSAVNHLVPVVVLSGSQREDDIHLSYAYGASSYVTKPMDIQQWLLFSLAVRDFWFRTVRLPAWT